MNEILLRHLNKQLVSEYEAIFNYTYYSVKVQEEEVREAMEVFSRHELEHARILSRYILELGGEPLYQMPPVHTGRDIVQLLIWSIAAEESAVKKYTMILFNSWMVSPLRLLLKIPDVLSEVLIPYCPYVGNSTEEDVKFYIGEYNGFNTSG